MREGFIIHPEDVLPLRPHMSTENFGELLILFIRNRGNSQRNGPTGRHCLRIPDKPDPT